MSGWSALLFCNFLQKKKELPNKSFHSLFFSRGSSFSVFITCHTNVCHVTQGRDVSRVPQRTQSLKVHLLLGRKIVFFDKLVLITFLLQVWNSILKIILLSLKQVKTLLCRYAGEWFWITLHLKNPHPIKEWQSSRFMNENNPSLRGVGGVVGQSRRLNKFT